MDILFQASTYQATAQGCLVDLTPPTFAGIASLVARPNGALRPGWLAGTDASLPLSYEIYIQKDTATGLFSSGNIALVTRLLTVDIFQDALGALLEPDQLYFVGVRARDALGNLESNTASLSAVSTGVPDDNAASLIIKVEAYKASVDQLRLQNPAIAGTLETESLVGELQSEEIIGIVEECQ